LIQSKHTDEVKNIEDEEDINEQMKLLDIQFHNQTLDFTELKKSSYILIRHGMSEANFAQKVAIKNYGSGSK